MQRTALAAAIAAATICCAGSAASTGFSDGVYSPRTEVTLAREAAYHRHTCVARSRLAMGYWTTTTVAAAKVGALRQCAVRTPRGLLCVVVSCS
jgi:hypothetical protein